LERVFDAAVGEQEAMKEKTIFSSISNPMTTACWKASKAVLGELFTLGSLIVEKTG